MLNFKGCIFYEENKGVWEVAVHKNKKKLGRKDCNLKKVV